MSHVIRRTFHECYDHALTKNSCVMLRRLTDVAPVCGSDGKMERMIRWRRRFSTAALGSTESAST